jgi:hypothetical protein
VEYKGPPSLGVFARIFLLSNRVQNHNNVHALWLDICALHEKTKSEHEEHYHLVMKDKFLLGYFLIEVLITCSLASMFL